MAREMLYAAARTNDVRTLDEILQKNPRIIFSASIEPLDNPLHEAALFGHKEFAKAIMDRYPELSREKNDEGYYPIHLASSKGRSEFVSELLEHDPFNRQCFLEDREGRTPLQLAAIKGQVKVVRVLLTRCPESAKHFSRNNETVLHLVVKYNECEVMELLLPRLSECCLLDEIVNCKDEDGNTVLHLAAARKLPQMLKMLSRSTNVDMNAVNSNGLTALETSVTGSSTRNDNPATGEKRTTDNSLLKEKKRRFDFSHLKSRAKLSLNGILILNSLLATLSFEALLNLPGSFTEHGQGGNITHSEATIISRNLPNYPFLEALFYLPYKYFSVANAPLSNITAPVLKGPVEAISFNIAPDPFHFFSFLGHATTCFFTSLATIIMALACSFNLWGPFILIIPCLPLMSVISIVSAGFLYISVLALVTSTPTAFMLMYPGGLILAGFLFIFILFILLSVIFWFQPLWRVSYKKSLKRLKKKSSNYLERETKFQTEL